MTTKLCAEIAKKVGLEGHGCFAYLDPIMWKYTTGHVQHAKRKEKAISPDKLKFKVVDIASHRLYLVLYEPQYTPALMTSWGTPGIGISIRGGEYLLKHIDTLVEVPFEIDQPPAPTFTPEAPVHELLRQRVVELIKHGAKNPSEIDIVQSKDVFLLPSGMAGVFRVKNLLEEYRPGPNVELGVLFHNTHELYEEESVGGLKHIGRIDDAALDELEAWLKDNSPSFVTVEFPCNPSCGNVDLKRLYNLVGLANCDKRTQLHFSIVA